MYREGRTWKTVGDLCSPQKNKSPAANWKHGVFTGLGPSPGLVVIHFTQVGTRLPQKIGGVLIPQKKAGWAVLECPWISCQSHQPVGKEWVAHQCHPRNWGSGNTGVAGSDADAPPFGHRAQARGGKKRALMEQDLGSGRQTELRYPGRCGAALGWVEGEDCPGLVLAWTAHHLGASASAKDSLNIAPQA